MKYGFIGAGKMAEAILQVMLDLGAGRGDVVMAERAPARAEEMAKRYGVRVVPDAATVAREARTIFLAVRPQDVASVAGSLGEEMSDRRLLVSIVAGKTLAALREAFGPKVRMVRVMPNLALRAKRGMCAVCGSDNVRPRDVGTVAKILGAAGKVREMKERDFDAVTALSGSGPAFFAYMLKAMADGGVRLGLDPDSAQELAEQTALGTLSYLQKTSVDRNAFISEVSTKGGTTAAGMDVMAASDLREVVAATLAAAARRSAELKG